MNKVYLPTDYVNASCKVVNNGYIRVYTNNSLTTYTDVYVNQNYMLKEGYSNYGYNGQCDNINEYTDDFYYRNDFSNILLGFFIMSIYIVVLPILCFKKLFKRGVL